MDLVISTDDVKQGESKILFQTTIEYTFCIFLTNIHSLRNLCIIDTTILEQKKVIHIKAGLGGWTANSRLSPQDFGFKSEVTGLYSQFFFKLFTHGAKEIHGMNEFRKNLPEQEYTW